MDNNTDFDNNTTFCADASMSGPVTAAMTIVSLILYAIAFFVMSTAVGRDPRVTTLASWRNNCGYFCQFLKDTFGGLFFCCSPSNLSSMFSGANSNSRAGTSEFEIPTRSRRAGGGGRVGFQSLSNTMDARGGGTSAVADSSAATDIYAENSEYLSIQSCHHQHSLRTYYYSYYLPLGDYSPSSSLNSLEASMTLAANLQVL